VRFGILGATQVWLADGTTVPVGGPRVRALLALLLLDAGRVVSAERLVDGLYGDNPSGDAANALQSQVSRLRRGLGEHAPVELHPAGYRLAVDPGDVDAHRFQRLADEGRHALSAGDPTRARVLLREALGLWRGPALVDAPSAVAQAARLEELRVAAAEDAAEAAIALGEHSQTVAELRQLVAAHPLRERSRALLMRALYAGGRQAEALAAYEDARRTLADELGADPSAELAEVHLAILRADPTAPVRSAALPAQLTSFVGREDELAQIGKALDTARLVTLTGPGGAGKTRLAVEAGGREPGEVSFVDIARVAADEEVPRAVLGALGVRETGLFGPAGAAPADPVDRLVAALTDRRPLLVLDNCEHVVAAAAALAHRLLSTCPQLRILATSREPLGITGETLRPVPRLTVPPPDAAAVEAAHYPAVRLFADRAAAVRPGFAVDAGNLDAVRRICAALDGLPLAIELAAARLRTLTVDEVAARLDDRFRLLSRGSRTAAPRHQTLRAVVGWSWDLLDAAEQTLAGRLTVFTAGATAAAAARVCAVPDADDVLAGLVDKSLVEMAGERYRMLDTIRAYCAERLAEAGDEERMRRAHAGYFLDLAQTADRHLLGADQLDWLDRLSAEQGNLHAALRWAISTDPLLALRFVAALAAYWYLRGLRGEGGPLAAEVLDAVGPEPPAGMGEEYALCALTAVAEGSPGRLSTGLDRAEAVMAQWDRPPRQPFVIVLWAQDAGISRRTAAGTWGGVAGDDPWLRALFTVGPAFQGLFGGDLAAAEQGFATALDGFRAVGDRWGMALALDTLALLADWRGDWDRSLALTDEALGLLGQLGVAEEMADLLNRRGGGWLRNGDPDAARADHERAAELGRRAGSAEMVAEAQRGLGDIDRFAGDLVGARRRYEEAVRWCPAEVSGIGQTQVRIHTALGRLATARGDAGAARSELRDALALALRYENFPGAADAVEGLAGVALLDGDPERAAWLLGAGVALRGTAVARDPDVARVAAATSEHPASYERGIAMSREEVLTELGAPRSADGA
jgi:predicted ATPase/DNA-binding SARP family transcriptional activator